MIQQYATETPALTPAGRTSLHRELQTLRGENLPAVTAQLAEAREDPAARNEDAGLLALLQEHSRLDRRATEIERLWEGQLGPTAAADGVTPEVVAFLRARMLANCPIGLRSMAETLLSCPDRTAALADGSPAPMLVIYGEDDDAWAPAVQEDMAHRLGAQRVCIPAAAHSPAVEAPETVASTLTSFWNKSEAREHLMAARTPLGTRQP